MPHWNEMIKDLDCKVGDMVAAHCDKDMGLEEFSRIKSWADAICVFGKARDYVGNAEAATAVMAKTKGVANV